MESSNIEYLERISEHRRKGHRRPENVPTIDFHDATYILTDNGLSAPLGYVEPAEKQHKKGSNGSLLTYIEDSEGIYYV